MGMADVIWTTKIAMMVWIVDRADVLGKKKIECPVKCDPNLLVQAGQFAQINRPPHPPGEETREVESENPGHAHAAADRSQKSDCFK